MAAEHNQRSGLAQVSWVKGAFTEAAGNAPTLYLRSRRHDFGRHTLELLEVFDKFAR
jgi:hypothetical protein